MSFVPFQVLLPVISRVFFYLFSSYLSSHPKINVSIHSTFIISFISTFLNVSPTLASHKKRNKQQSHVYNYSNHPSSYLPVIFFFLHQNGLNLHSYLLGLSAMKHVFFFFTFLHESTRVLRTFVLMANNYK